ncbi:MAG: YncE family protein [Candidatus Rokuibacteriota bacterium]
MTQQRGGEAGSQRSILRVLARTELLGAGVALWVCLFAGPSEAQETVTLFVTSQKTDTVQVLRGPIPRLEPIAAIRVGREPHNLGISPDGRWVATSGRRSGDVSLISTDTRVEVARIPVGRQPHDVAFSEDNRTLYVGHEQEPFVSVIDVPSQTRRASLAIRQAQHDLSLAPDGRELWFTITNRPYKTGDPRVGVVELASGTVTMIDTGANAHDVILSPDGRTAWVTNSGFLDRPDDRVHVLDVAGRRVLEVLRVGRYPFHAPKRGRDGNDVPPTAREMWFSDHGLKALVSVSLTDRRVLGTVPVGAEPFHLAATASGMLFVANHGSGTVTIVDASRWSVLGTLQVAPRPHGLAVLVR